MDILTLKKAEGKILDRARNERRFSKHPIIDGVGYEEYVTLKPPAFERNSASTHPQTGATLSINEPAIINTFPKEGIPDYTAIFPTTTRVATIDGNGRWWAKRNGEAGLFYSDNQGETWSTATASGLPGVGIIHVTESDSLIITHQNTVYRSTDGGESFALVLTMQDDASGRPAAVTSQGSNVYIGEYSSTELVGKVYKSGDDGATWSEIDDLTGDTTHIHFVAEDPYTGDIWYGTGDIDAHCKLRRSTDGGTTWTTIGEGSQAWRLTDIVFYEDAIYFAGDGWIGSGLSLMHIS